MGQKLFSLAELNHLRTEAMQLFEQCLTNNDETALVEFIQRQVTHEPPRLQLLRDIADDLQQRLLSLREYHFDVRERVVLTLSESYQVDVTPLTPAANLDNYHHLTAQEILDLVHQQITLTNEDTLLLRKLIEASLRMAHQLFDDIQFTLKLYNLVEDWIEGISIAIARENWHKNSLSTENSENTPYH
jgi:hypothetical protein